MQLFDSVFEFFKIPFFIAIFEKQIGELVRRMGEREVKIQGTRVAMWGMQGIKTAI